MFILLRLASLARGLWLLVRLIIRNRELLVSVYHFAHSVYDTTRLASAGGRFITLAERDDLNEEFWAIYDSKIQQKR